MIKVIKRGYDSWPTVYASRAYGEAFATHSHGEWVLLGSPDGTWQVPLIVYVQDQFGFHDAQSPYGYGGIIVSKELGHNVVRQRYKSTVQVMESLGIVTAFLRFMPYNSFSTGELVDLPDLKLTHISDTITVDLHREETMWQNMKGRARTSIRKANRLGYSAGVSVFEDAPRSVQKSFVELYNGTMKRVGAAKQHFYGDDYYSSLSQGLGSRMLLVYVADRDGIIVAACIIFCDDTVAHYHLSGSAPGAARDGVNNLLIWTTMKWAFNAGYKKLHLGGGIQPKDSLFHFKASFGGTQTPFHVGHLIVNHSAYASAVSSRAKKLGIGSNELLANTYFPAYRSPEQ